MKKTDPPQRPVDAPGAVGIPTDDRHRGKECPEPRLWNDRDAEIEIARGIRRIQDLDPPAELLPAVMGAIQAKRLPWWLRAYRWAISPKHLTITPIRLAPGALLLVMGIAAALFLFTGSEPQRFQAEGPVGVPVVFVLSMPEARSVAVIGTFNQWKAQGYEMRWDKEQERWSLVARLPSGRYEYAFLVDGQKIIPDPRAFMYQEDGFGNRNAVLILGNKDGENI